MLIDLPNTGEALSPLGRALPRGTSRHLIANGVQGTAQTIAIMQKLVNSGKRDNSIRELCGKILNPKDGKRPCASKDYFCYAKALYTWVRQNILYAYDPNQVEFCEHVKVILLNGIGDCDSMDILLCSMFEHVGLPSQFVTIKADASRPDEFTHVFCRVKIPKVGWVCADPIMPEKWFGWEPPYPNGKRYWAASSDELDQPVDTTPSVPFPEPSNSAPQMPSFDDVVGMSGLGRAYAGSISGFPGEDLSLETTDNLGRAVSGLGHGGHHGGGGRGRGWRGGGGWGWGGPGYWGGGFDDNVYVLPVAMPDQFFVIPSEDQNIQAMENPMMEQSTGFGGVIDDYLINPIKSFANTAVLGLSLSNATKEMWFTRIVNGSVLDDIRVRRSRAFNNIDAASKIVQAANKSGKASAISAANRYLDAARAEQSAISDEINKYDAVALAIKDYSFGKWQPKLASSMSGLGVAIESVGAAVAVTTIVAAISGLLTAYVVSNAVSNTAAEKTKQMQVEAEKERAILSSNLTPQQQADALRRNPDGSGDCSWFNPGRCIEKFSGDTVKTAMTLGLIGVGFYALYRLAGLGGTALELKVKSKYAAA